MTMPCGVLPSIHTGARLVRKGLGPTGQDTPKLSIPSRGTVVSTAALQGPEQTGDGEEQGRGNVPHHGSRVLAPTSHGDLHPNSLTQLQGILDDHVFP